jgi:hypothetical protein
MSRPPARTWPPLIVAAEKPRWVWWRDFALTIAMWVLFAIMLQTEFELFFGRYLERLGLGDFDTNAHWERFFERLTPYIWLIVMLLAFLGIATVLTIHRARLMLRLGQPPALPPADQAARGGMTVPALLAARKLQNAVVHVEADGRHRVEPRQPSPPPPGG